MVELLEWGEIRREGSIGYYLNFQLQWFEWMVTPLVDTGNEPDLGKGSQRELIPFEECWVWGSMMERCP